MPTTQQPPEAVIRRSLIGTPLTVSISGATLAASLIVSDPPELTDSPLPEMYEYVELNPTHSLGVLTEPNGIAVVEATSSDLPAGDSFTDADAAAVAQRLAQHRSGLPITEVDLGSDI